MLNLRSIFIFLGGGSLFYLVYVIANVLQNPALAAIVSLLPISLFSCYFIESQKTLNNYLQSLIVVFTVSLLVTTLLYIMHSYFHYRGLYLISGGIVLWILIQYILYKKFTCKFR